MAWYVAKAAVKYNIDGSGQHSLSYLLDFVWVTIANFGNALNIYYHKYIWKSVERQEFPIQLIACLFIAYDYFRKINMTQSWHPLQMRWVDADEKLMGCYA